ncbi:hypothetical protein L7F22_024832 [Adiantum nelumboides]|nr:hypothetical protein [Adiantum nelumboides]
MSNLSYLFVFASHVLLLNDAKVKENDTLWLVKSCVPWCKHCLKVNMTWDELGKALDMEDSFEIVEVHCISIKENCNKVETWSYTTIKLFYNGEEYKTYTKKVCNLGFERAFFQRQ